MKIAIGADHGGYNLKEEIKKYLDELEIGYVDVGTNSEERVDYPVIAKQVCKSVQNKEADFGIVICKTGYGMSIVANKFKGIRCAACYNQESAKFSKLHNDINVLALGAEYVSVNEAICILRMIFATDFEGGRHNERLNMIKEIEKDNMK